MMTTIYNKPPFGRAEVQIINYDALLSYSGGTFPTPEVAQKIIATAVVGRGGTPDDVARAAMFFISPDNGFVTGQVLHVCGGASIGGTPW